ncbi:hypothetical protein PAECIP111893_04511 [Paenibacillus plantiphilus]|uniref:Spore germination protein n=1 Tax=Paenibacillus plantiphilus TaxID=2905650 RepID=A0ABN8H0Z1_9BACL|nr:spore germination protein [Paenibacillus plantiphilus]CAH1219186.1 hypothetical protein PAECIP111893_04511 [Paenibacillus plantiphilus]
MTAGHSGGSEESEQRLQESNFTGDLVSDLKLLQKCCERHSDTRIRELHIGHTDVRAAIVFIEGLSNNSEIQNNIIRPLMSNFAERYEGDASYAEGTVSGSFLINNVLSVSEWAAQSRVQEVMTAVLAGSTALLIAGSKEALILGTTKGKARSLEEPVSEAVVRGARIGFTELLSDNIAILRQQGKCDELCIERFVVGKRVKKDLVIAYMEEIANPQLVEEVKRRIAGIDMDMVHESGYVEQLIEDSYLSPFPQLQSTERPDRVMAALVEGRVGILLDGTPFALIAPVTFSMLLQSPEDYAERWISGTLFRLLRLLAALNSLLVPALYISFISFHPGLIPTKLAMSILGTREGVPFSSLVEALIMEVSIEILREAGLRLPKPIGPAMGIVGGLVIGEAAVQAGIVSPILVIVVAVTAISSFAIPQYNAGITLRMLRFIAMFCSAVLGLYGVVLFFLLLCSHMVKLKSFGVPYASPASSIRISDWKDFFIRAPIPFMKSRPKLLHTKNTKRKG